MTALRTAQRATLPPVRRGRLLPVIDRTIGSGIAKTLLAVLSVLVLIFASDRFVRVLGQAIEGKISGDTIVAVMALRIIAIAIGFLPAGLFAAVLMVLGRMYRDNEMASLAVGGIGIARIYRAVYVVVLPLSLLATALSFHVLPWSERAVQDLMLREYRTAELRGLSPGRFNEFNRGEFVLYVADVGEDGGVRNVFIQERKDGKIGVVAAPSGRIEDRESDGRYIVLENGYRYYGQPGQSDYNVTQFKEYGLRIGDPLEISIAPGAQTTSSAELWRSGRLQDLAELERRLSIPMGMLILAFLAVPLARIAPRGGVYGNLFTAFLIYVIYENLLKVAQRGMTSGVVPLWLGDAWVYAVMLIIAFALLARNLGIEWMFRVLRGKTRP